MRNLVVECSLLAWRCRFRITELVAVLSLPAVSVFIESLTALTPPGEGRFLRSLHSSSTAS